MSALAKPPVNGRRGQRQSRAAPASQLHPQSTTASNHPSSASGTVHPPQTNSRLELTPMRGEFINFDVDTTYVMSFNIRNRTPEIQTLRFIPPQKPQTAFRLVNVESVRVAPGLSHVVDVEFSTHITRDYEDVFTVLNSNGERLDVELVAHSVPKLEFGTNIYFGKVEHNRMDVAKSLHLINRGRKDAVVTLVPSETSGLTINPSIVVARALGETSVTIELTTLPIGVHHWPISVTVDGEKEPREVMAHVEIVDCRSTLVDPSSGQEAVSVGFAKVYAGSKKRYELVVVNGSEQGVSFAFQLANEMAAKEAPPFHFKPEQGRLGPKERRTIAVEFAPPINPVRKGWSCLQSAQKGETRKFEALFSLLFVETEQTHNFHIVGESAETEAWISRPVLDFGECPMNDYRDESIELFNGVLDLPLNYTFDHVPNFRIDKGSGVVPPGGSKIINITYQPRRLGKYSEKLKVEFNGTVSRVVTLIGYSSAMTPEVKATMGHMMGGTDKLPGDFKRPRHAPDRPRPADDISADDGWRPTAVDQPQAVDIGMIPGEGMRAPQPSTIIPPRELQEEDAALRGPSGHVAPISFDTKTLIKRRYPEVPGNAMERRDCRRELMPMDLLKVVAPIKVVQFDRITVGASAVKSFYVYNGTNASILVTMPGEEPHTQFSPLSQVIPTNRMAQFDVCLCSSIIQQCMQVIQFTVNNHHRMRFTLQAEVVPVEVAISQKEAVLNFSEFTDEPITKTTVTLANNGNSDACYSWVLPPKVPFTISPDGDVLAPMSKAIAEITFTPPQGVLETSCEAILKVEGATEEKRLSLTGVVAPTLCSWTKKLQINGTGDAQVDLRRIAAGQETSVAITLMNRGTNNAYYSFDPLPQWLSITPSHGRVCKGESEELIFTVLADTAEAIQHVVLCNVRGMRKPLRMSLTAHVIAPTLTITSPERTKGEIYLDYGEVYVGTECTRKIQFKNTGDVPAVVQMDLHAHPGFFLQIPDKSGADDTEGLADVVFKSNIPNNVRVVSATNSATSLSTTEAVPGLYVVTIPPNTESWINILYSPQAAQSTTKTTVRWVQVGSGDSHPLPPLLLVASALPSRLAMTTKCVKFPEVVAGRVPKPYSLMVQNLTDEQIPWSLEVVDGQGRPTGATDFLVEPSSGSFAPLESQTVTITFLANNIGQFNNYVRLMADGDRSKPCAELMLVATATKPRLLTDQRVIIFPPVPLGVEVKETIFVINDGFDSITVDYEGECSPPVSVSFPRGNILSFNTKRIPVEISFMSSKPITVASSITFTSNRNEQITVSICGTAINSILSTFGFVKYREKQSTIGCSTGIDPDKTQPFMIRDSKGTAPGAVVINYGDKATAQRTLESFTFGMLDATGRHVYGRAAVENITRWVNGNILRSPVENIVETLQLSHGGIMYDIIERLFGRRPKPADSLEEKQSGGKQRGSTRVKKIQSAQSAAPVASTSTKKSSIDRGLVTIETLLSFIKAYGCCLSSVRSKFLLTYEEYLQLVSRDESFGPPLSALLFMVRSSHAWVTVLLETIRVFYMSRLRMDAVLKTTPALTKYLPMDRWNSRSFAEAMENSNVYSPDESLLLQWVRCSLDKYNTVEVTFAQHKLRVVNFDDLRDARVLLAAVLLYVPAIRPFCIGADRQIVSNPVSSVEHETNAYVLLSALTELGATDLPTPKEYLELSQLDYTLFAAFLMNMLPRFIATETIHFEGRLLASITKTIEVVNASNIARQYRVMMENTDFTVSAKELTVAPNSTATLNIIFRPKYHRVVEGRCLIVDHSPVFPEERGHLAFDLKATPNTEPSKVIQLESPLYETLNTDIAIESPFPTDCVVSLRAVQEFLDPAEGEDSYAETEFGRNYKHAFFVHTDVLPLRRNEATKLPLQFIPLCRGKYQLKIFFREDREGEFSYLVNATCTSPKPSEAKIDFRSELGEDCFPGVTVRASHSAFERSVRLFEERSRQFQTIMRNVGLPDMSGNVYTVSFLNEHMQGPNPFFEMAGGNNVVALPADGSSGSLRFSFKPKYIGQYTGFIMLTSPIDVRLLRFSGECVPKGERHMLHFACPARQTISQDITINNNTNKDWLITATLEGESFSGLKELRVPKGKHKEYSLKFSPAWISKDEEKGTLVLQNNATGQKHTYALVGEADSPLSEDTITIECRAREHQTVMLNVPNVATTDCTYFVETDLPFAQGDTSVIIPRASFSKYTLNIMPTVGGNYSGKVVFKSHQGRYVWYVINVRVTPPEREGIIDMRTDVRTSIVADVRITNPLNKALIFSVRRYGAGLFGENFLKMEALETLTYSCLFVPANIGEFDGRLSFCNDEIGEFWYALKMFVDDSQPEELAFESTLGVPTSARVKLPNMTEVDCPLTIRNTNPINFSVSPAVVVLPSNSEALIDISYTPTAVGVRQEGTVTLSHHQLGEWKYACNGIGSPPEPEKKRTCVCEVGASTTLSLPFTNTFDVDAELTISLTGNDSAFFSVKKGLDGIVPAGASTTILLAYTPKSVGQHSTTVEVQPTNAPPQYNVQWSYPIEGTSEWREATAPFRFLCVARKQHEDLILLRAPGLTPEEKVGATVMYSPDARQHYVSAVVSSFECSLVDSPYPDAFQVAIKFSPLRPMAATGDLLVKGLDGGAWRYRVYLEATPSPIDDTVLLRSAYNTSTAVVFDLYNVFPFKSKFVAYFTGDSSKDFSVAPSHGVLLPFVAGQRTASAATPIRIAFCPSTRVPQVEGTLVVDTDDMQWSFRVIGKLDHQARIAPQRSS